MNSPQNNNAYSNYVPFEVVDNPSIHLRAMLTRYLQKWYWFVIAVLVMLAAAYVYLKFQVPQYKTQASLLIKDENRGLDETSVLKELEAFSSNKVVENEIEILKSYTLLSQVVRQLNLGVFYYHDTPYGKRELFTASPLKVEFLRPNAAAYKEVIPIEFNGPGSVQMAGKTYPLNQTVSTPFGPVRLTARKPVSKQTTSLLVQLRPEHEVAEGLVRSLKAEPISKAATVIFLTLETAVPDKGEVILNHLIEVYNQAAVLDKNKMARNMLSFIDERLKLISGELSEAERNVANFKSANSITDLSTQGQELLQTVQENDALLNEASIRLNSLRDVENYLAKQPADRGGTPATVGLADPVLLSLVEKANMLEARRQELVQTTPEQHPAVRSLDAQIRSTKASISENVANMRSQLNTARGQYASKNARLERLIRSIPTKERGLIDITRQQGIKNNLYTYLLQKREETALSFASTISDSRTVDAARSSLQPVRPNERSMYMLFSAIGMLIPIIVITVRDALNNRIRRRTDVEQSTQVPIIGEIIKNKQSEAIVISDRSQSIIAEQIRTLRTNLNFLKDSQGSSQVLLFTSSISGEGKSFVSLNLGASLALVGKRTVVLEMDLRKPRLRHALSFKDNNAIGLSNYLIGDVSVDEIIRPIDGFDNYSIIYSGPIPPNPSELLSGPHLEKLISALRERFDYIIIDAPPIGLVTDAQIIAPFADATLFIVRHDLTPRYQLKMIETYYQERRFNKLNIVLNAVADGDSQYYSYGYRGNGYNYSDSENNNKSFLKRIGLGSI